MAGGIPAFGRKRSRRAISLWASVAVIAGAATHLLWDSFTHGNTPMVDQIPLLESTSIPLSAGSFHCSAFFST